MPQIKCPNCGSYKTVSRRAVLIVSGIVVIVFLGIFIIPIPIGIGLIIAGLGMRDRLCQSCKFKFGGENLWTKKIGKSATK